MHRTRITSHTTEKRQDERRFRSPSKPLIQVGEMTYMVLITIAAALLTGVLALPFTMPGKAFAEAETAFGAADFGASIALQTATEPS